MKINPLTVILITAFASFSTQCWANSPEAATTTPSIILSKPSTVLVGSVVYFNLTLSSPAPAGGVVVAFSTSNSSVLLPTPQVTIAAGATTPSSLPGIWGMGTGTAYVTATATGFSSGKMSISVEPETSVSVIWSGARWEYLTIYGKKGNYQAMGYTLNSPVAMTMNATLFFKDNCDPSAGTDNMNDYDMPMNPGSSVQGFSMHPNTIPSSAIYWFGPPTSNGMCPAGAPCSGCVNYTKTTPGWVNP